LSSGIKSGLLKSSEKRLYSIVEIMKGNLSFVVSSFLSLEVFYKLKNLSLFYNTKKPHIEQNFELDSCFSKNYTLNFSLSDIIKSDFCFLVNSNPRFEGCLLNIKLKKRLRLGNFSVSSFGSLFNLTYDKKFHGLNPISFLDIVEGKHSLCKKLKNSKTPLFIFGINLIERFDNSFF
jgi:NADH dehydrogenase/NADH:ubiquinone oxidoreductase subunit G